jgi:hypothetical protein
MQLRLVHGVLYVPSLPPHIEINLKRTNLVKWEPRDGKPSPKPFACKKLVEKGFHFVAYARRSMSEKLGNFLQLSEKFRKYTVLFLVEILLDTPYFHEK